MKVEDKKDKKSMSMKAEVKMPEKKKIAIAHKMMKKK